MPKVTQNANIPESDVNSGSGESIKPPVVHSVLTKKPYHVKVGTITILRNSELINIGNGEIIELTDEEANALINVVESIENNL